LRQSEPKPLKLRASGYDVDRFFGEFLEFALKWVGNGLMRLARVMAGCRQETFQANARQIVVYAII
jgi:hypothetical protein